MKVVWSRGRYGSGRASQTSEGLRGSAQSQRILKAVDLLDSARDVMAGLACLGNSVELQSCRARAVRHFLIGSPERLELIASSFTDGQKLSRQFSS